MTRLELLELIATLATNLRNLEKTLPSTSDPHLVTERLDDTRRQLDEAIDDLKWLR